MKTFNDSKNRVWTLSITLGGAKRVKDLCNVDLLNPISITDDGRPLTSRLFFDDLLLMEVVSALCCKQIDTAGLSKDEWFESIDANAIANAQTAFIEEYRDFFTARGNQLYQMSLDAALKEKDEAVEKLKGVLSSGATSADLPVEQDLPISETSLGSNLSNTPTDD